MVRPSKDEEIGRAGIIERARQRFHELGYAGTSMRHIADAAGITKAALYYHFTNKDDLYLAVLQSEVAALRLGIERGVARSTSLREALEHTVETYTDPNRADVLALLHDARRHLPDDRLRNTLDERLAPLGPLLPLLAQHAAVLRVAPEQVIEGLLALIAGRNRLRAADPTHDWTTGSPAAAALVDLLLHGIMDPAATDQAIHNSPPDHEPRPI